MSAIHVGAVHASTGHASTGHASTIHASTVHRSANRPAALRRLLRHFPFTGFLVVFLPLYALLMAQGHIGDPADLAYIVPFVLAITAGYVYNNIVDRRDPEHKGNPVATGELSPAFARAVLALALLAACTSFALQFRRPATWPAFGAYLVLMLAYSGLGLRFKESWLGPFLGAAVLWVGGPLILALELDALNGPVMWLLAGAWLTFSARELCHTLTDLDDDRASGYRTFAVRAGPVLTGRLEVLLLVAGTCLWVWILGLLTGGGSIAASMAASLLSARVIPPPSAADPWHLVVPALGFCVLIAAIAARLPRPPWRLDAPYALVKLGWIAGALLILDLDPLTTGLLLWLFLTSKIG